MPAVREYIYKEEKPLGKGSFGTVYKVYKKEEPDVVFAMKKVTLKGLSTKDKGYCRGEIEWMQKLQHPNIIQYHDSFEVNEDIYIVMEFCQGGSLRGYINSSTSIPVRECLDIMGQICTGLKFLHDKQIMHRDVKTSNIFLQGKTVKLGDLALLKYIENSDYYGKVTKKVGTLMYMSPEMVAGKPYGFETDIWSLGCCMYEIAMRQIPYPAKSEIEFERKITSEPISMDGFPYDDTIRNLLQQMLDKDPDKRPQIQKVSQRIQSCIAMDNKPKGTTEKTNQTLKMVQKSKRADSVDLKSQKDKSLDLLMATFPGNRPKSTSVQTLVNDKHPEASNDPTVAGRRDYSRNRSIIVQISVKLSEDEFHMMCQADSVLRVLQSKYLTDEELDQMFKLLENNMEEKEFLDKMENILGKDTFGSVVPFLKSFWLFKAPLLKKSYKMICQKITG